MVYLPPYSRSTSPPSPSPRGASSPPPKGASSLVPETTPNRPRRPTTSMILIPHSSSPVPPSTSPPTSVWHPPTTTSAWVTTTTTTWTEPPWVPTTTTTTREPPVVKPPKPTPVRPTNNPIVTTTAAPIIPSGPSVGTSQTSGAYATQTAMNINPPTNKAGTGGGLPTVAVVGIAVVSVLIVGFVVTVFVMKSRGRRRHKPLGQTDLFDHLPIDPPAPPPPMTTSGYYPQQYMHQNHHQHPDGVTDQGGAHQHELDNLYDNTDYHQHMDQHFDHHGGDGHHDQHHHDYNDHHHQHHDGYQPDPNQGQAHQGNFYDQGQGISDQGQAYQGQQPGGGDCGYQGGIPDQMGANQSGFHDPGAHGISDQGTAYQGQLDHHFDPSPSDQGTGHQNPLTQIGGNSQPPALHQSVNMPGPGLGGAPPPMLPVHEVVPDIRRTSKPKINSASRPPSSQYSMLLASPTNSHATADYGLVDETSLPARGSMAIGPHYSSPPAPQASLSHRISNISQTSSGYWEDPQQQQDYGYSPTNKQSLLDQSRYYNQQQPQPDGSYVRPPPASVGAPAIATTAHTSSRVLPVPSPRIATIPPPLPTVPEVRAPQDRNSEAVGALTSTGNVSGINTFDRRHPQTNPEGVYDYDSVFYQNLTSPTARDPQQR